MIIYGKELAKQFTEACHADTVIEIFGGKFRVMSIQWMTRQNGPEIWDVELVQLRPVEKS